MEQLYHIFSRIFNMSITAGIIICMVLAIRILLRRAPKIFSYLLWSVVLFRLLCPITLSSSFSALRIWNAPAAKSDTAAFTSSAVPNHNDSPQLSKVSDSPAPPVFIQQELPEDVVTEPKDVLKNIALTSFSFIWLAGVILITGYGILSTMRLKKRLAGSYCIKDKIYITDSVDTPFTMGILSPKIYLPEFLSEREKDFILLHEQTHIRRGDHIVKLLAFLALTIHWFNPFVWIAFLAAEKDMEMSCDEIVMKKMNEDIRAEYSTSLLCLATGKRILRGTPLAFGEGSTKSRVKNIMQYKKPAVAVVCTAAVFVCVCIVGFGTNPKEKDSSQSTSNAEINHPAEAFATDWAKAFCGREGEKIAAMSTEEARENLKETAFLEEADGSFQLGLSSPWPWNADSDYRIVKITDKSAEILYYARTSDPHVTVWRESLELIPKQDSFLASSEQLEILDAICSEEEFKNAYPDGLSNTPMDYLWDNTAESLNQNALLSSSWIYKTLSLPETAAVYLLNLSEDTKASVTDAYDSTAENVMASSVTVKLEFPDGFQTTVQMIQPFNQNFDGTSIWIPLDDTNEIYSRKSLPDSNLYSGHSYLGTYGDTGNSANDEYQNKRTERVIYSVTADVTHDGIEDSIDSIIADEDVSGSPYEIMGGMGAAYIKVYPGKEDGSFSDTAVFVSREVMDTHAGNGQIGLVEKDGLSYLLVSDMYEIMGTGGYSFAIFHIDVKRKTAVCSDEDSVQFAIEEEPGASSVPEDIPARQEVIPSFQEYLQLWLSDALLFVSCDTPDICLSLPDQEYRASDYYDKVWER